MATQHGQSHPAVPAAPAMPPAPQWQPLNWSFPFAPNSGASANPQTWMRALASADGGFYPLGANGMFHGGIHFDAGTGCVLKQGDGVKVIADGEVVAYRLDSTYPELKYPTTPPRYALYSAGFVLVRHKLVLPPEPAPAKEGTSTTTPAAGAPTTNNRDQQGYQPPADEVLEFYSLYMHQLDWAGYKASPADGNRLTPLIRPLPFWQGERYFRAGSKANDRQTQAPRLNTPFRFDQGDTVSGAASMTGNSAQLAGIAAGPSPDSLGSMSMPVDDTLRYTAPVATPSNTSRTPAQVGINIRERANGRVLGILPKGGELSISGNATTGWAQISSITKGTPVAAVEGGTPDPRAATGWVFLGELDAVIEPKPLDTVVVLDTPFKVSAGDVVGYLGEYQNSTHSQVLPPKPMRPLLHVEVFTGAQINDFIAKSRDRATRLPDGGKPLLVMQQGAKFVKPADPQTNAQLSGLTLVLAKGDPGKGNWAKVQPTRASAQPGTRAGGRSRSSHTSGTPVGNALWVERKFADTVAGASVQTWADFPLRLANTQGSAVEYQQVLSRAQLDELPAISKAVDEQGAQWWSLAAGDSDGKTITGWICEKQHPGTQWQSPWSWPAFDTVDTTSVPLFDLYRRNLFEVKQLLAGEEQEFGIVAATVNAGQLVAKLQTAAKRQGSGSGNVVPADLKKALTVPWLAAAVSHLVIRYESEWGGDMNKWERLLSIMGDAKSIWRTEMERIKNLQWWDKVTAVKNFPASPDVWHIHPIGLVGNFLQMPRSMGENDFTEEDARRALRYIFDKYGRSIAETVERMYRTETRHFESMQYRKCGTGGMEVHGSPPWYGWTQAFFTEPPIGTWSAYEGAGLSGAGGNARVTNRPKDFVVVSSVEIGMEFKARYIVNYDGNYARWYSTDPHAQELYRATLQLIKPKIVNSF